MADNLQVDPSTGAHEAAIIAAKDIGGVKYPRSILTNSSGVDFAPANPLPVSVIGTVVIAEPVTVEGAVTLGGVVDVSGSSVAVASLPDVALEAGTVVALAPGAEVALAGATTVGLSGEVLDVLEDILLALRSLLSNSGTPDTAARLRVNVETGAVTVSSGTVTTVTTLANMAAAGGYNTQDLMPSEMNSVYGTNIRANIVVS